ncbi:hypothetical protein ILYODFUR_000990 [Ilyodon furcidens]|uniref:Fork-head domain-containing protein n=1 Tax=Ilyodon furcidens TaxID=33524 RepID=A0ABV0TIN7_9TELE
MAEAPLPEALPDLDVIIDPDFEPKKRPRSCTWPLPRPDSSAVKPESTEPDIIPEEEDDEEDSATPTAITVNGFAAATEDQSSNSPVTDGPFPSPGHDSGGSPLSTHSPTTTSGALTPSGLTIAQTPRKASSRRNAWGNLSYADLITKAIESSPEKRLTLSQIYDWMVRSIPYFKDKGDSNSSAGWKVRAIPAPTRYPSFLHQNKNKKHVVCCEPTDVLTHKQTVIRIQLCHPCSGFTSVYWKIMSLITPRASSRLKEGLNRI